MCLESGGTASMAEASVHGGHGRVSGGGEGGSEWRLSCDRRRNLEHPEGLGERRVFKQ